MVCMVVRQRESLMQSLVTSVGLSFSSMCLNIFEHDNVNPEAVLEAFGDHKYPWIANKYRCF